MADATAKILRDLDNPRLYHKVERVPIFVPHTRKKRDATGKLVDVKVTLEDLKEIAEHNNRRVDETGTLAVITLGHRKQTPDFPETQQPPLVGFCKDWEPGRFGPGKHLVLFYNEYVRQAVKDEVGQQYPFRSADFYPGRNEISGVAALKRDPELDLGTIVYAGGRELLCYSREVQYMADPTMPPDPDAAVPPVAGNDPDAAAAANDEAAEREQYERHCASHPYARAHHEKMLKYAMEAGGAPGGAPPAMPGATDNANPGQEEPPLPFARGQNAVAYARVQNENKQLKARLDKVEKDQRAAIRHATKLQYQSELQELTTTEGGGLLFDVEEELPLCLEYSRAEFDAHKARLARLCAKDPTGGPFVEVARISGAAPKLDEKRLDQALTYAREHGVSVDEAVKKILSK